MFCFLYDSAILEKLNLKILLPWNFIYLFILNWICWVCHNVFSIIVFNCSLLSCESHFCKEMCHIGECKECPLLPKQLLYCPCGKRQIKSLLNQGEGRQLCTDPIPTCDSFCGKKLNCGPKGNYFSLSLLWIRRKHEIRLVCGVP